MTIQDSSTDDLSTAVREGRPLRPHGPYQVMIGDGDLRFEPQRLDDPVPTGRQILQAAGAQPVEEHLVFQVLRGGELEELRLDETTDLRAMSVERFLVFRGAESYRLELDGLVREWGAGAITGRVLKRLAGVTQSGYGVWLEVRGQEDRPVADDELVRLDEKGLERFFTGTTTSTEGATDRVLPMRDRRYLEERQLGFEEVVDAGQRGVVLKGYPLPDRFQVGRADILILLPASYPDAAPDMFYALPWLELASTVSYPLT